MIKRPLFDRIDGYIFINPGVKRILVHPEDLKDEKGEYVKDTLKKLVDRYPLYPFKVLGEEVYFGRGEYSSGIRSS